MKKRLRIGIILLCMAFPVYADTMQYGGIWNEYRLNGTLPDERFLYLLETNFRFLFNRPKFLDQNVDRIGFGYVVNPKVSVWIGYALFPTNNTAALTYENRLWQQVSWDIFDNDQYQLSSRTRLEQRCSNKFSGTALRMRELIRIKWPWMIDNKLRPMIYEELFFNFNHPSWVTSSFLSQNRLFLGFEAWVSKHTAFTFGYLNQYTVGTNSNQVNHIFYTAFDFFV